MKVNESSSEVQELERYWAVARALLGGTETMRAAKTALLPKWSAEETVTYEARLATATLFPALERTVSVMSGKPFSKDITFGDDVPKRIQELCDDVDLEGRNLHAFASEMFDEGLGYGLCGILVDYPVTFDGEGKQVLRTVAEEKAAGVRPYFTAVKHSQLRGWKKQTIGGKPTLTMLRIMEYIEEDDGEFGVALVPQVRVLEIGLWRTFREKKIEGKNEKEWVEHKRGINTLPVIPFAPVYGKRKHFMCGKSPLENVGYLNVKHWQSQSDQDTILHVARVPVLVIIGSDSDDAVTIGTSTACKITNPEGDMKYVEHTGAAIKAGAESLKDLEDQMIQTGAELLVVKPGQRTATESNNEAEGNKSDLQRIVETYEDSLNMALGFMAMWINEKTGGHITLHKEWGAATLDAATGQLLVSFQQAGWITKKTGIEEAQRRNLLDPSIDPETELQEVEEEGPALGTMEVDPLTGLPLPPGLKTDEEEE